MSERSFVEKPFLDQLASLGWQVIDHGPGVPTDPTKSFRTSFRQVILQGVFRLSLHEINRTAQGQPWLTDKQIDDLIDEVLNQPAKSLVEANEAVLKLLYRAQVDVNEVTGEQYPNVKLIDFEHPGRDHFLAINQFRIDTPGAGRDFISTVLDHLEVQSEIEKRNLEKHPSVKTGLMQDLLTGKVRVNVDEPEEVADA